MTYEDLRSALQAAVVASLPDDAEADTWVYVYDFSDTFVIYYNAGEYYQDNYTLDDEENVTLAGEPVVVRPVTTYQPVGGGRADPTGQERRGSGPAFLPAELRAALAVRPRIEVHSEQLTYHRYGPDSYFRDLVREGRGMAAVDERLRRHRREMEVILAARNRRALRALNEGELEYRIEPNRTPGEGGYFSPPLWVNQLFATANRPRRVLADLIQASFELPPGVSSINLPVLTTGTAAGPAVDTDPVPSQDITDAAGSSTVITLAGEGDFPLQHLEQSPLGAALDWVVFLDLAEACDADYESQLLSGLGAASDQLLGVMNVPGIVKVQYTAGSPTGAGMWPFFGQAAGQLGDSRQLPPEAWLLRTARWAWLQSSEDTSSRPYGLGSPFFLGSDDETPDPVGGLISWPAFCDDAIPVTNGQDVMLLVRPSDMVAFQGVPQTAVMREVLSGDLGVRLQMHVSAAAVTNRRPASIAMLYGTGFTVQAGF